ncbi:MULTISPECIES: hypothetical protein [Salinibaculum]|uniref:hypothetical protein n=1 Tax=Salinibaculum TaxID=2732368 RepID=UPI0030CF4473
MTEGDSYLRFTPLADRGGLEIIDRIERRRYKLHTPAAVSPTPVDPESFRFPVGQAVAVTTSELVLPRVVGVYVRDDTGSMVAEVEHLDSVSLPAGTYTLELSTQIKTYIRVEGPLEIAADFSQTRIGLPESSRVAIGARSRHKRPADTITTTTDPRDMMAAVETFGSALKTADPERSYPTLRGHPPAVELGETLDIPSGIERPDTGIRLELPPTLPAIYVAAPLAFYLGAELEPGTEPRLVTTTGFEHTFSRDRFEREVEHALKQVFFLDCVTRTEGYYEIDLHERNAVEPHLDLDFEALYDQTLAEQVETYLQVPYELLADHIPQWRLTTHVEPTPDAIEQLPFVIDDLSVIRTAETDSQPEPSITPELNREFTRDEVITRSTATSPETTERSFVQPESTGALEEAWIGESIPIGASKLTIDAFENRLERETTDGDITISIVVNDERMNEEEDLVDGVYGDRDNLPFDVSVHRNTTVAELRELLTRRTGFLHYIGHTEQDGLECADGKLDVRTVEETGVDAFLLNSCNSYEQGLSLIEAGGIGGIVTLNEVINEGAVKMGETIARLLNSGFPLRAALTIARDESVLGGQYIVVGDGGMTVTQAATMTPNLLEIEKSGSKYEIHYKTFATDNAGLGSVVIPYFEHVEEYFLSSGEIGTFRLDESGLSRFLELEQVPVRVNDNLFWSRSLRLKDLF